MDIENSGIEIFPTFITQKVIDTIITEVSSIELSGSIHGIRNAEKKVSSILDLANSSIVQTKVASILDSSAQLVRAIFFDKTPDKNWLVTWHQDKTIAVNKKVDLAQWGPWSIKDGIHHVQPPLKVLEQMLTLRIHLDDADESNGCIKIIPDSHKYGIIKQKDIASIVKSAEVYHCIVNAGDAIAMRPHLLHSSSKSSSLKHRRVVHLEFSNYQLPNNLSWA